MKKAYLELVKQIRNAVRKKANNIGISEGCIRILAYPCCELADQWLGGLSDFRGASSDIADYEYTFSIEPYGSRIAIITDKESGARRKIDCYGLSALKIAHCSYSQDEKKCLLSGVLSPFPYIKESNGYCPELGAFCAEVNCNEISNENGELVVKKRDFCEIYISVSGDKDTTDPEDNLRCASAAVDIIEEFFMGTDWDCDIFEVVTPAMPYD